MDMANRYAVLGDAVMPSAYGAEGRTDAQMLRTDAQNENDSGLSPPHFRVDDDLNADL